MKFLLILTFALLAISLVIDKKADYYCKQYGENYIAVFYKFEGYRCEYALKPFYNH